MQSPDFNRKGIPLVVALTALLSAFLFWIAPQPEAELQEAIQTRVDVVSVRRDDFFPVEKVTGRLIPAHRADLKFEVSGRLVQRDIEAGQRVAEGDLLLALDDADFRNELQEAEARLDQERSTLARDRKLLELASKNATLQRKEAERIEKLGRESLASASQLDEVRQRQFQLEADLAQLQYTLDTARSRLSLREAEFERAQRDLARTRLKTPFAAVINSVSVDVGDYVQSSTVVVQLVNYDEVDVYLELPGHAVGDLALNATVPVRVEGQVLSGRLVSLQTDPDPATHTHAIRIRVPGEGLLPGLLARIELPLKPLHQALAVPVAAILRDQGRTDVFVHTDEQVHRRPVVLGPRLGDRQVIFDGLSDGDVVVARDVAALSDGLPAVAESSDRP